MTDGVLVLSVFPGIGLLDMAFEQEGFCVVRGPDVLWGGDIRRFRPPAGRFNGIIGGPPCQTFSPLANLVRANGHEPRFGNLVPEFERCVAESGAPWFLMENVPQAPEAAVAGYGVMSFLLDNSWLPTDGYFGQEQRRLRKFCFGLRGVHRPPSLLRFIDLAVFVLPDGRPTVTQQTPNNSPEAKRRAVTVTSSDGGARPSERRKTVVSKPGLEKIGRYGKAKRQVIAAVERSQTVTSSVGGSTNRGRYRLADACRLQGLPEDFLTDAPFTSDGKLKAIANGVPLPMGRAVAKAVKSFLEAEADLT